MVGPHRRRLRPHLAQAWALREMCVYSHHTASRTSDHAKAAISSSGLILTVFLGADTPRSRSTGVSTELACPTHTCACPSPRSGHHWLPGQPLPCSHVRQRPHTLRWPAFSTGPAPPAAPSEHRATPPHRSSSRPPCPHFADKCAGLLQLPQSEAQSVLKNMILIFKVSFERATCNKQN